MSTLHMVVTGHRDIRPKVVGLDYKAHFWTQTQRWFQHAVTKYDHVVMHNGCARGMDTMFKWVANKWFDGQIEIVEHVVTSEQWDASRSAGKDRNKVMIDTALNATTLQDDKAILISGLYPEIEFNHGYGGTLHATNYAIKQLGIENVKFLYPRHELVEKYKRENPPQGRLF